MSDATSSQHPVGDSLQDPQAIAAAIFARHGIDFATAHRGGGWTNAVWLADGLVLRLSTVKGRDNVLREARLAELFPPAVGYPRVVETGTTAGHAWTLAARLPGTCLGDAWGSLSWDERTTALQDLWERAQAVHTVPVAQAEEIAARRAWFNSNDPVEAEAGLSRLTAKGVLTPGEGRELRAILSRFWDILPDAPCVLCHGDLTLDNAVWHAGHVIGLLDFEYALMAPAQFDLNHLVKAAWGPQTGAAPAAAPTCEANLVCEAGPERLRRVVQGLAQPLLTLPGGKELMAGYAVLLELWLLELWLAHPEGEGPLEQWEPLRRLRSLANGKGGYLAPLVG